VLHEIKKDDIHEQENVDSDKIDQESLIKACREATSFKEIVKTVKRKAYQRAVEAHQLNNQGLSNLMIDLTQPLEADGIAEASIEELNDKSSASEFD